MTRSKVLGFLVLLASPVLAMTSKACDCPESGPPCKAFAATPVIFVGRVTDISPIVVEGGSGTSRYRYEQRLVRLAVKEAFRGLDRKTAEVVTGEGGGDCGYEFQRGENYLVYAYPDSRSGKLGATICSRTRLLRDARDDLEYIRQRNDPAHGAGIEGRIEELARDAANETSVIGSMAGVDVAIESESRHWTARTQADGRFQIWGLAHGSYRVTPILPKRFVPVTQTVKLERSSCADLRFLATPRAHPRRK